ncbi:HNH endonuclease signature motif containing protein [Gordonia jinhuaensis]|uniref:HNH endonuclease n=1 Tax=Gordonia jinhuaensis TaxID=1517702 RepID=A0A916WUL7_9ACTN|nr:HNH endonuclease signature motif containing protein [Gordonia jinhuaensis]GGB35404.1 HNH endonuclease [Gordonia jinhuaensis]
MSLVEQSVESDPDLSVLGLPESLDEVDAAGLGEVVVRARRASALMDWHRLRAMAEVFERLVAPYAGEDRRVYDAHTRAANEIAMMLGRSQAGVETELMDAAHLFAGLPQVAQCLHDGVITGGHIRTIIARTALVGGQEYAPVVDAELAEALRRQGSWSLQRLRDMCDRIVFRHDPAAVRERRKASEEGRRVWAENATDGTAVLHASMTAENVRIAAARVDALASSVCDGDPRRDGARRSDAVFALLSGELFECQCDRGDQCDATIPAPAMVQAAEAQVIIHVITEAATLEDPEPEPEPEATEPAVGAADAEPTLFEGSDTGTAPENTGPAEPVAAEPDSAEEPEPKPTTEPTTKRAYSARHSGVGFMDGYGVISGDYVRELAQRTGAVIRPINPAGKPLRPHLPSDPYRPSIAMNLFIRIRDGYCTVPGCDKPAFAGDLDHVHEYDHDNPAAGGQTTAAGLATKCRMHHQMKTDGVFLDDQYIDATGKARQVFYTQNGATIHGYAESGDDLFPTLRDITFTNPEPPPKHPPPQPNTADSPTRRRPRLADTHARRRQERERNRKALDGEQAQEARRATEDRPPF